MIILNIFLLYVSCFFEKILIKRLFRLKYNNLKKIINISIVSLLFFITLIYYKLSFIIIYLFINLYDSLITNELFIEGYQFIEIINLFIYKTLIDVVSYSLIFFIMDKNIVFDFWIYNNFFKILWIFISKYIQIFLYILITFRKGNIININIRYFKNISIILSLLFSTCIVYNNTDLFYFETIGRTMVFTLIVYNAALIAFDRYQVKHERIEREFAEKEKQFALVQQKQRIQDEYNQLLEREQKHVRNIQHDMNNHLMAMLGYIDRQDVDGVRKYVNDLLDESKRASQKVYTGHVSVDAILDAKILKARSLGIDVKESFEVVSFGIMKCVDLTKLLGCTLDNAIEAILRIEDDTKKKLQIRMYNNGPYLIVCIGNSIAKGIDVDFSHTSKTYDEKNHGFGVKDIKSIAFEYDGSAYYEFEKDFVMLNVILYVKRDV